MKCEECGTPLNPGDIVITTKTKTENGEKRKFYCFVHGRKFLK